MGTLVNGIKEIFATAKTTGSNVILCGNDGTPDGHMTMANLASVLGVTMLSGKLVDVSNQDENYWNSICGDNYIGKIVTGYNTTKGGSMVSIGTSGYTIQIFKSYNASKTEIRNYYIDTLAWNDWCEIALDYPLFYKDYADIVSLTSGVKKAMRVSQNTLVVPANGSNSELALQANPFTVIKADTSNFNGCIVLLCDHADFMVLGNFGGFNDWVALSASGGKLVIQNKTGVKLSLPVFTFVG